MANALAFKPKPHDPRKELAKKLETAPEEHAESLLVLWQLLEVSHQRGILDMLVGAIGSKNAIAGRIATYAKEPASTQAIRNALTLAQVLGSVDPDVLARIVKAITPVPTFTGTSEADAANLMSENPVLGRPQTEDKDRRAEYEHRGEDLKSEAGRGSVPKGESAAGSPQLPALKAKAARDAERDRAKRSGSTTLPFDMNAEPPSLWQLFKHFTGKDARRALAYAANTLTTVSGAIRGE